MIKKIKISNYNYITNLELNFHDDWDDSIYKQILIYGAPNTGKTSFINACKTNNAIFYDKYDVIINPEIVYINLHTSEKDKYELINKSINENIINLANKWTTHKLSPPELYFSIDSINTMSTTKINILYLFINAINNTNKIMMIDNLQDLHNSYIYITNFICENVKQVIYTTNDYTCRNFFSMRGCVIDNFKTKNEVL